MDRETIQRHLDQAERLVAEGVLRIERQKRLIAELERDGHAAADAKRLLETLLDSQAIHEAHLRMVRAELRRLSVAEQARNSGTSEPRHR